MGKTKKLTALICSIFICHMAFSNPKLSAEQKKMGNLLVRINQNFMLSEPCLAFNPNIKKVYVTTITYSDIKNGVVDFGDWDALTTSTIYTFNKNLIDLTESVVLYRKEIEQKTWYKLIIEDDKMRVGELINCYDENGQLHPDWGVYWTYTFEDNFVKILEGKIYGKNEIIKTEKGYDVFLYGSNGRKKNLVLINENKKQIIEETGDNRAWWQYENGILIAEHNVHNTYRYTVTEGTGEYQKKEGEEFKTIATLVRKVDRNGYLTYQRIEYPNGKGQEIYIDEKMPDVSGVVNKLDGK